MTPRNILKIITVLPVAMLLAQQPHAMAAPPYTPSSDGGGLYTLQMPTDGSAVMLPPPGDKHNDCLPGDVIGLKFSPDGRYLVAQVVGRDSATLCLYTLRDLHRNRLVRVERLGSGTAGDKPSSSSRADALKRSKHVGHTFQEQDPTWKPILPGEQETRGVAFSRSEENKGDRLFGLPVTNGRVQVKSAYTVLDGGPTSTAPDWFAMDGHWSPVGKNRATPGMAFVTNQGLTTCGKARVAFREIPDSAASPTLMVTDPCADAARGKDTNVADSYLAWDPGTALGERGRLAFVRIVLGRKSRLCVVDDVFMRTGTSPSATGTGAELPYREKCYAPVTAEQGECTRYGTTFSRDGKWLLNFCSLPAIGKKPATVLIEGVDLASERPAIQVLARDVLGRDLIGMGPTLLTTSTSSLFVIPEKNALEGLVHIWTLPLVSGARPEVLSTGLKNLKAVAVSHRDSRVLLALVAQASQAGGDADRDKVFLMNRPIPGTP